MNEKTIALIKIQAFKIYLVDSSQKYQGIGGKLPDKTTSIKFAVANAERVKDSFLFWELIWKGTQWFRAKFAAFTQMLHDAIPEKWPSLSMLMKKKMLSVRSGYRLNNISRDKGGQ